MVLLTVTPTLVAAIKEYHQLQTETAENAVESEFSLLEPEIGKPISHEQVLIISKCLKKKAVQGDAPPPYRLNDLLRGSHVYIPPPKPKVEKTAEYRELMTRLRHEEEARMYEQMTRPQPDYATPAGAALLTTSFAARQQEDDEMTYSDVNRQMTLIFNVIVTVVACGVSIWLIARHLSAPSRLALSMGGAFIVGIAEVVIYAGYLRRLMEAKSTEKRKKEVKRVTDTWTTEKAKKKSAFAPEGPAAEGAVRNRKMRG